MNGAKQKGSLGQEVQSETKKGPIEGVERQNMERGLKAINTTRIIKVCFSVAVIAAAGFTSSCQDRLLVNDTTPFGEGVVRLGDTEVAEIDGTKIYLSDVERTAAAQGLIETGTPLTPASPIFQRVLDELIDQRLLALDALRQALDQSDETRRRLAVARERILGNMLVEEHLKNTVNETNLRRIYDEQSANYKLGKERRVRHILRLEKEGIDDIAKRLDAGEDFATLASEYSEDRVSRENGGDIGYFREDMLDAAFTTIAFTTPIGEQSAPFKTEFGWHILEVEDERTPKKADFADVREEMLNFMTYDEIQKLLQNLRDRGDVKLLFGQAVLTSPTEQNVTEPAAPVTAPQ